MPSTIRISDVRFTPVSGEELASGLLGFVTFVLNDTLRLDGLTLRRTLNGRAYVSFPSRTDGRGARHPYMRPLGKAQREEIERQVLEALGVAE